MEGYAFSVLGVATILVAPRGAFAQVGQGQNALGIQARLDALLAQVQQLREQLAAQQGHDQFCRAFLQNLGVGDRGSEVVALHKALGLEGFAAPADEGGTYSEETAVLVIRFQAKYGIRQTGYVGPLTRAKLNALYRCVGNAATQPSITVLSPNGGEGFMPGQAIEVSFAINNLASTAGYDVSIVRPLTSTNPAYDQSIFLGTIQGENLKRVLATIPWNIPLGDYKIRVDINTNLGVIRDQSDNFFAVASSSATQPSITVTSPNGGETYRTSGQISISYNIINVPSSTTLSIRLEKIGGSSFTQIIADTPSNSFRETYLWTIPSTFSVGSDYRVTLYAKDSNGNIIFQDSSDAPFTITAPDNQQTPTITVTSPNGGERWQASSSQQIRWTSSNIGSSSISIRLLNAEEQLVRNIAQRISNASSYPWIIPSGQAGGNYKVVVLNDVGADGIAIQAASDKSDNFFTITSSTVVAQSCPAVTINGYSVPARSNSESATVTRVNSISNGTQNLTTIFTCNNGTFSAGQESSNLICRSGFAASGSQCVAIPIDPIQGPFTLTLPNGGESLVVGHTHRLTWTGGGTTGTVEIKWIKYADPGGYSIGYGTIATFPATSNTGSFDWTVPSNMLNSSQSSFARFKIQIRTTNNASKDLSDGYFTVTR